MVKEIYKLHKSDLIWHLKPNQLKKIIEDCFKILDNPDSSERARGIARGNLLQMNQQNITLCDDVAPDNQLKIIIEHEKPEQPTPENEIQTQLNDILKRIKGEDGSQS